MPSKLAAIVLASGLLASPAAHAQSWGRYGGYEDGYHRHFRDYDPDSGLVRAVCSGQRAHMLEARLGHEVDEGEIDERDARRIHAEIDRLEDKQRHECAEGDWRAVRAIAARYDRVGDWIGRWAHGGDRRGW